MRKPADLFIFTFNEDGDLQTKIGEASMYEDAALQAKRATLNCQGKTIGIYRRVTLMEAKAEINIKVIEHNMVGEGISFEQAAYNAELDEKNLDEYFYETGGVSDETP